MDTTPHNTFAGVGAYRFFRAGSLRRVEFGRKKKLGRCSEEQRPNPDSRRVTEATQGERQPSHVHVTVAYLYSEAWLAVAHLRSARINFRQPLAPEGAVPIGFCSGGFTSTSSLRSGQRGSTRKLSGIRYSEVNHSPKRRRVFIRAARETPVGILPAPSLSASAGASLATNFTAVCCPQASRHHVACRSPRRSRLP